MNTPWSNINSSNSNTGYTAPTTHVPIYTHTPIVFSNIPPPVTNPAHPNVVGFNNGLNVIDSIFAKHTLLPGHIVQNMHRNNNMFYF